jgi:hypothetical protein
VQLPPGSHSPVSRPEERRQRRQTCVSTSGGAAPVSMKQSSTSHRAPRASDHRRYGSGPFSLTAQARCAIHGLADPAASLEVPSSLQRTLAASRDCPEDAVLPDRSRFDVCPFSGVRASLDTFRKGLVLAGFRCRIPTGAVRRVTTREGQSVRLGTCPLDWRRRLPCGQQRPKRRRVTVLSAETMIAHENG